MEKSEEVRTSRVSAFGADTNKKWEHLEGNIAQHTCRELSLEIQRWVLDLSKKHPDIADLNQLIISSSGVLQIDTLGELGGFLYIQTGKKKYKDINFKLSDIDDDIQDRAVMFLLVSNFFNRWDEQSEKAMISKGFKMEKGRFAELVTNKSLSALITDNEGKKKRVNPMEYIVGILRVAEKIGLDSSKMREEIIKIIEAQKIGISLIESDYTVQDAINYRIATVGRYYRLLFYILSKEPLGENNVVSNFMYDLNLDDMGDIDEDINSQPNPYIALLRERGLLGELLNSTRESKVFLSDCVKLSKLRSHIPFVKIDRSKMILKDDVSKIKNSYVQCDVESAFRGLMESRQGKKE